MLPDYEHAKALFGRYGLELSTGCYEKLDCYASFLVEYNQKVANSTPKKFIKFSFNDLLLFPLFPLSFVLLSFTVYK